MSYLLVCVLVLLTTAPLIDALRRENILVRPEFYLLVAIYLYGTCGYLAQLVLTADDFIFIIPVSSLAVHTSYLYSSAAVFAIYMGGGFYRSRETRKLVSFSQGLDNRVLVILAAAGCLLALAFNTYYFYTFGLFSGSFDRVEFMDDFKVQAGAKVPYLVIMYACLPILALRERLPISWLVFLPFALLHLSVGNRRIVLAAFIMLLVAKLLRGWRIGRRTIVAVLAVVGVVGVIVGDIRGRGEGLDGLGGIDAERIFLALSEFTRPFVALAYYVDNGYDLLYGKTLIQAFPNLLPGFLSPFGRFTSPGQQFVNVVEGLDVYSGRVSGYGFFPVAEALMNFGPIGIPIFFLVFTLIVRKLSALALSSEALVFAVPLLCATMFAFGRNAFTNVLSSVAWVLALGVALYVVAALSSEILALRKRGAQKQVGARAYGS